MVEKNRKNSRRRSQIFPDLANSQESLEQNEQLQIIYKNKNYQAPSQRDYETIYEGCKRGHSKDGSLELGKSLARRLIEPYSFWKQDDRERVRRRKLMIQKQFKGRPRPKTKKLTVKLEEELARLIKDSPEELELELEEQEQEHHEEQEQEYEDWLEKSLHSCLRETGSTSPVGQAKQRPSLTVSSPLAGPPPPCESSSQERGLIDCPSPEDLTSLPATIDQCPGPNFGVCSSVSSQFSGGELESLPDEWLNTLDCRAELLFCGQASDQSPPPVKRVSVVRSVRRSARFIPQLVEEAEGGEQLAGSVFAQEEVLFAPLSRRRDSLAGRTKSSSQADQLSATTTTDCRLGAPQRGGRNKENRGARKSRDSGVKGTDDIETRLQNLALNARDLNTETVSKASPTVRKKTNRRRKETSKVSVECSGQEEVLDGYEPYPVFSPTAPVADSQSDRVSSLEEEEEESVRDRTGELDQSREEPIAGHELSGRRSCEVDISLPSCVRRSLTGEFLTSRPLYEDYPGLEHDDLKPQLSPDDGQQLSPDDGQQLSRDGGQQLPAAADDLLSLSGPNPSAGFLPWSDSDEEEERMIAGPYEKRYLGLPLLYRGEKEQLDTAHLEDSLVV